MYGLFQVGDLTQIYPIARGSAPMLVARRVPFSVLGVTLSTRSWLAVLVIGLGLVDLDHRAQRWQRNPQANTWLSYLRLFGW